MDIQLIFWAAVAAACVAVIIYLVLTSQEDRIAGRLANLSEDLPTPARPVRRGSSTSVGKSIPRLGQSSTARHLDDNEEKETLRDRIIQAGLYKPYYMAVFTTARIVLCIALVCAGILLGTMGLLTQTQGLLVGLLAGVMGTVVPSFWLDHLKRKRQTKIRRALPDALDVIVVCLEGGLSVPASLARVASELATAHPMLALELQIVEREIQMGRSTGEAMRQFAQRFDLEELRSLSSVIMQAEQFGTSVTKALDIYANTMRTKRSQRAEEKAQRAVVHILFPTLLCIFPGIFIVLLGPAAIQIYKVIVLGVKNGTL